MQVTIHLVSPLHPAEETFSCGLCTQAFELCSSPFRAAFTRGHHGGGRNLGLHAESSHMAERWNVSGDSLAAGYGKTVGLVACGEMWRLYWNMLSCCWVEKIVKSAYKSTMCDISQACSIQIRIVHIQSQFQWSIDYMFFKCFICLL